VQRGGSRRGREQHGPRAGATEGADDEPPPQQQKAMPRRLRHQMPSAWRTRDRSLPVAVAAAKSNAGRSLFFVRGAQEQNSASCRFLLPMLDRPPSALAAQLELPPTRPFPSTFAFTRAKN
jgi:hypothetical protein